MAGYQPTTRSHLPDRWASVMTISTGLLLVIYLGVLLVGQYRAQVKVNEAAQKSIVQETEKLATILAYYLGECRSEIETLARSHQVNVYFKNRALGMSLQYGLLSSLNAIRQMTDQILEEKKILNQSIFTRILITDESAKCIYDTANKDIFLNTPPTTTSIMPAFSSQARITPLKDQIMVSVAAMLDGKMVGNITAWLNSDTAHGQLVSGDRDSHRNFFLYSYDNGFMFPEKVAGNLTRCKHQWRNHLKIGQLSLFNLNCPDSGLSDHNFFTAAMPVLETPLLIVSMVPASKVLGSMKPWQYGIIMLALAVSLLFLYVMQVRITRKNVELKTIFNKTSEQQEIIIAKNIKLASEIRRRRDAESTLKSINETLEERVKQRTAKLNSALDDLRSTQSQLIQSGKLASIGELAAGVAHELNQPLMVIRGNAQLMMRMVSQSKPMEDQLPEYLDSVERNTKRMILIINHLRSFSRQSSTDFQSVNINQVIKDAFLMIGEQLRLRNIKIIQKLADPLPKISGDPHQLEQVFLNIITNAKDAIESYAHACHNTFRQDRCLTIQTHFANGDKDWIRILFTDSGCGIDDRHTGHIFDPFFTTKEVGKGTGLGLSLSYGIVDKHGGRLRLLGSRPGKTTFSVELPISPQNKSSVPAVTASRY